MHRSNGSGAAYAARRAGDLGFKQALVGAILIGANLTRAEIAPRLWGVAHANLTRADLSDADLTRG